MRSKPTRRARSPIFIKRMKRPSSRITIQINRRSSRLQLIVLVEGVSTTIKVNFTHASARRAARAASRVFQHSNQRLFAHPAHASRPRGAKYALLERSRFFRLHDRYSAQSLSRRGFERARERRAASRLVLPRARLRVRRLLRVHDAVAVRVRLSSSSSSSSSVSRFRRRRPSRARVFVFVVVVVVGQSRGFVVVVARARRRAGSRRVASRAHRPKRRGVHRARRRASRGAAAHVDARAMAREQRCATTARATDDDGARRVEDDRATDDRGSRTRRRATDARRVRASCLSFLSFLSFDATTDARRRTRAARTTRTRRRAFSWCRRARWWARGSAGRTRRSGRGTARTRATARNARGSDGGVCDSRARRRRGRRMIAAMRARRGRARRARCRNREF